MIIGRRGVLGGLLSAMAAPAIVSYANLMPVRMSLEAMWGSAWPDVRYLMERHEYLRLEASFRGEFKPKLLWPYLGIGCSA